MLIVSGMLGVSCLLLGAGVLALAVRDYLRGRASVAWPTAAGVVTATRIEEARLGLKVRYTPVVRYRYEVGGIEQESDQLALGQDVTYGSHGAAEKLLMAYAVGSAVHVRYDPTRPRNSVLQPGASASWLLGVFSLGVFFLLIGVAGVWMSQA